VKTETGTTEERKAEIQPKTKPEIETEHEIELEHQQEIDVGVEPEHEINIEVEPEHEIEMEAPDNTPPPPVTTHDTSPKELRIGLPAPFNGKKENYAAFIQAVGLYLMVNHRVYSDDAKKIAFALSFCAEGEALHWQESFIINHTDARGNIGSLGTWEEFLVASSAAFKPLDSKGDALFELQNLRQGSRSAEDVLNEFEILLSKAKIIDHTFKQKTDAQKATDPGDIMARDLLTRVLNGKLVEKVLLSNPPAQNYKQFMAKAITHDLNYRRMKRIFSNKKSPPSKSTNGTRYFHFNRPTKDPNAMDVDSLTIEQ